MSSPRLVQLDNCQFELRFSSDTEHGCTPGLGDSPFGVDVVGSGSFQGTFADSSGTVFFDTTAGFAAMPSLKGAEILPMALALLAVFFTATAIGTVFHDKY